MGLLKLRRSRGSPSHSASLRERSRARPARPPAPWTSEQGTRGGCSRVCAPCSGSSLQCQPSTAQETRGPAPPSRKPMTSPATWSTSSAAWLGPIPAAEPCCLLELLFLALHSPGPPSPLWPGLLGPQGSSSALPCPPRGAVPRLVLSASQHVLPEFLLRVFLFLHFSIGELIALVASTVTSMPMISLEKLRGGLAWRWGQCQGTQEIEALGASISQQASRLLRPLLPHRPLLFTAELPGPPFQRA
nr:cardiotrophin-like cytokine factor 1 isoform X4 [Bubalus bubalis]